MAVLPIRLFPDPVLRVRCPEVVTFDDALAELARDMVDTMHAAPGVGLAAPQVGREVRLAVVDVSVGERPDELFVLVNPEIIGGMVIRMGDSLYDASIAGKLKKIKKELVLNS